MRDKEFFWHTKCQGRIQQVSLGGGAISVILGSQVLWRVHYRNREVYFKKYCCDKTMGG